MDIDIDMDIDMDMDMSTGMRKAEDNARDETDLVLSHCPFLPNNRHCHWLPTAFATV